MKVNLGLERLGTVDIETAFDAINAAFADGQKLANLNGHEFKAYSQRYELFMEKGTVCAHCGLKAKYFAIERHTANGPRPHLNLYGIDDMDDEVLFTKDHIVPKSQGGANEVENYQTMCMPCNTLKADGT